MRRCRKRVRLDVVVWVTQVVWHKAIGAKNTAKITANANKSLSRNMARMELCLSSLLLLNHGELQHLLLLLPVVWNAQMCTMTKPAIRNGIDSAMRKAVQCRYQRQDHQQQCLDRITHKRDRTKRPVITVAPQNDICPHGRTYPIKAVPIIKR